MKKIILLVILCTSCAKYQVVQELKVNLYHLHNPKTGEIEIIVTEDVLTVGEWYKLKQIDIIETDNDKKEK